MYHAKASRQSQHRTTRKHPVKSAESDNLLGERPVKDCRDHRARRLDAPSDFDTRPNEGSSLTNESQALVPSEVSGLEKCQTQSGPFATARDSDPISEKHRSLLHGVAFDSNGELFFCTCQVHSNLFNWHHQMTTVLT